MELLIQPLGHSRNESLSMVQNLYDGDFAENSTADNCLTSNLFYSVSCHIANLSGWVFYVSEGEPVNASSCISPRIES